MLIEGKSFYIFQEQNRCYFIIIISTHVTGNVFNLVKRTEASIYVVYVVCKKVYVSCKMFRICTRSCYGTCCLVMRDISISCVCVCMCVCAYVQACLSVCVPHIYVRY